MDDLMNKLENLFKIKESKTEKSKEQEIYKRLFKYVILWIVIALAANYVPSRLTESNQLKTSEIVIIATIGAITFAILDMYIPAISC